MTPFIRHMLLCDDVRPRPGEPRKVDVLGLVNSLRVAPGAFPTQLSFSVYLATTGGRDTGIGQIVILDADQGTEVYAGAEHTLQFPVDPLQVFGVIFRITAWWIPGPALYWVEFRYDGQMLARQPLLVREES